jgi:DNA-binding response OmpR family regulator
MVSKILVVDDERPIAETMRDIFQSRGYEAFCAYSGKDAVSHAASFHPDVLVSDVMMPELNGFETALQVKEICPGCRLILFTGQLASAVVAEGFAQTFLERGYSYDLLSKPLHPTELISKVQEALRRPG